MTDRHSARVVALFSASEETVDLLRWIRGLSDVREFIWCRFADVRKGRVDVAEYLADHNPQVVIIDIAPPYLSNWQFVQMLCRHPAMKGRCQVLITSNKEQLDAVLQENSKAIDIVASPDVLHQVVTAIEAASTPPRRRSRRPRPPKTAGTPGHCEAVTHDAGAPSDRTGASGDGGRAIGDEAPRERARDGHHCSLTPATVSSAAETARPTPAAEVVPMSAREEHLQCVRDAYRDKPHLRVTPSQAQRMFELEPRESVAVFDALVNEGLLLRTHDGVFVRREIAGGPAVPNSLFRAPNPRPVL